MYQSVITHQDFSFRQLPRPDQFAAEWHGLLRGRVFIDYCAFQDGTAHWKRWRSTSRRHKIFLWWGLESTLWNNVETSKEEFPMKFTYWLSILKKKLCLRTIRGEHITFWVSQFHAPNFRLLSARTFTELPWRSYSLRKCSNHNCLRTSGFRH